MKQKTMHVELWPSDVLDAEAVSASSTIGLDFLLIESFLIINKNWNGIYFRFNFYTIFSFVGTFFFLKRKPRQIEEDR